jgi:hypothetical protein
VKQAASTINIRSALQAQVRSTAAQNTPGVVSNSMKSKLKVRVLRHHFNEKRVAAGTIVETNY